MACTPRVSHARLRRRPFHIPKLGNVGKHWDFRVFPKERPNIRDLRYKDKFVSVLLAVVHLGAACAPFCYTKSNLLLFGLFYVISGMGITLSYHRQLTHRSFVTGKLLEYLFALCGVLAVQGHPIEWVSAHRHHHQRCDEDLDPHSPMDGLFWSHMGWLLDSEKTPLLSDTSNARDLKTDGFYRFLKRNYIHITVLQAAAFAGLGGLGALVWGFFLRVAFVWHVTWAVNSLSHVWGFQSYKTDDISMNNWFVALLGFGEGWHNNHHAFEESAAHGLRWWQFDPTWYCILALKKLRLARCVRTPSQKRLRSKALA